MSIGKIAEFKVEIDNWRLYVERLEQYFVVNKIPSELQVPTLITVVGANCYELLVNLCTPDKPITKTFKELTGILGNHLQPKPSVLAERFKFQRRVQKAGESISQYVADLKKMSKTCEFGVWLEESLRDQLVCGLASETIRQRLFAEVEINYTKAYQLASSMEAGKKVDTGNDRILHRHIDQIRRRSRMSDVPCPTIPSSNSQDTSRDEDVVIPPPAIAGGEVSVEASPTKPGSEVVGEENGNDGQNAERVASSPEVFATPPTCRPKRIRKPVVRFQP